MSETNFEGTAREIAASVLARSRNVHIPREILPYIEEMLVDAASDGADFAESYLAMDDNEATRLEHYTIGYIHGLSDGDRGQRLQEGEA